jgi:hypothetical protein
MAPEEIVSPRTPPPPGVRGVGRGSDLRVQVEHSALPVQQVELVHAPGSLAETVRMQELCPAQRIACGT